MPKGNKKRGAQKKGASQAGSHPPTDDENSNPDNWSTASVMSEDSSCYGSGSVGDDVEEDNTEQENFEDKLSECIDGLSAKSGPQRKKYLEGLKSAFSKKYTAEFLEKRKETICDSLLRCVKKGKGDEQALAAGCLSMLAVQLGEDLLSQYPDIQSALSVIVADESVAVKSRAECALALAMCCFLATDDYEEAYSVMAVLEAIFKQCFCKGDGTHPQFNPQRSVLNNSCLTAWCLLLTSIPNFRIRELAGTYISKLTGLLNGPDTELRITAGEAIALLYDLCRDMDDTFGREDDATDALCVKLKELSVESTKHMAKKDRRTQRSSFRDILRTVEEGEIPQTTVKIGVESLELEGWSQKKQYDAFCQVLGSGINLHLKDNVVLRDFWGLGSPLPVGAKPEKKMSKVERNFHKNVANKARTVARARSRDKRSAVIGF
ncbi:hypothetical protein BaRGS_00020181 [Batillaria attramentaria]|uniref:Interferon-related developmental regulator 1 n=1 Tax=Batillaria attramentaria TaxID=370345 RepID=A0ABD0KMW0_9CAEN|nr:hypothetical protein BaRGS_024232 [Batillaria attramentaria]